VLWLGLRLRLNQGHELGVRRRRRSLSCRWRWAMWLEGRAAKLLKLFCQSLLLLLLLLQLPLWLRWTAQQCRWGNGHRTQLTEALRLRGQRARGRAQLRLLRTHAGRMGACHGVPDGLSAKQSVSQSVRPSVSQSDRL
jgi:hypothetical protein